MKKGLFFIALLGLSFLFIIGTGCQDAGNVAVAAQASTLGPGGELILGLATDINARAGINVLDYDWDDREYDDVEYDLSMDFESVSGLLDWYIFDDSFHLTGGIYSVNNETQLDARPERNVMIGNNSYTPAQVGTITGKVSYDGLSPYLGIGWGNPAQSNRRWGFTCDAGILFLDSPDVKLYTSGAVSSVDLALERKDIEDDWDSLKFYPVISVGLFIRF
ncbi:MAG: hypothetical protein JXA96_10230 [Sedimentisphaerales bacterium]|nr:hypothetical protein [Sedimentisphaerales bacterium]